MQMALRWPEWKAFQKPSMYRDSSSLKKHMPGLDDRLYYVT
jgi:hypothetical protein